jgi:probable HAF family extracellular repeat protein
MYIPNLKGICAGLLSGLIAFGYLAGCDSSNESTSDSITPDSVIPDPIPPVPDSYFTGTGVLQGDTRSEATAVSRDGAVVVGTSMQSDNRSILTGKKAFLWTYHQGITEIGFLQGGSYSEAKDISDDGSIVLGGGNSSLVARSAFVWSSSTGMIKIESLGGSNLCVAGGLSGNGTMVVGSCLTFNNEAFHWSQSTGTESLGQHGPGSGANSTALAISSSGETIAGIGGISQAIKWTAGGISALVDSVSGESAALAVSDDDQTIVGHINNEAFYWTEQSDIVIINDPSSGITTSIANGVSADGQRIVGSGSTADGDMAFLWGAVDGMRKLDQVVSSDTTLDITGWKLTHATSISGDGQTIAGFGTNPDGHTEGFVLKLPD